MSVSSLTELLRWRGRSQPDQDAYIYLADNATSDIHLTFGELERQARAIGALLQRAGAGEDRALLIYPPGLEFLTAFFGCLFAGTVAVPVHPPKPHRPMPRLEAITANARARVVLTTAALAQDLQRQFAAADESAPSQWIITDDLAAGLENEWREPSLTSSKLAFLQYTSGTTSIPRGVMVSHGNLLHNLALITEAFQLSERDRGLFWLPLYHDMGLIGGALGAFFAGVCSVLMSPQAFLQRPIRWLEAISRQRATITGAPNFAYNLCVTATTPAERAALDLSCLRLAFCGAEPIRRETIDAFAETFAPHGFRREAFYPCYGLAEATLFVSGGKGTGPQTICTVRRDELERNRVVEAEPGDDGAQAIVGCGRALLDQRIVVVDAETGVPSPADRIGEIWVGSPSVAQGYWMRPEETERTFHAYLADSGKGPFLRTGDLGFVRHGELFVVGRLKDLIIIHGRNYYPQDLELAAEQSHPAFLPSSGAAFSIDVGGQERVVIVQEVSRHYRHLDKAEMTSSIRRNIATQHDLSLHAIVLVKPFSIPRTSSGKVMRHACRSAFLSGDLQAI